MSLFNSAIGGDLLTDEMNMYQESEKYSIQKFPGKGIDTYVSKIKEIFKNCNEKNEEELAAYVLVMGKLLNSLANMENPYLYRYEQRILFDAISLFLKFFLEQVDFALSETDVEKKVAIHKDISDSIQCIMEVYRNLIGSMTNADSQVSINFAIDTNLYEFSPKLTAFYADILNEIVRIYKVEEYRQKESQYGFIVYPSIRNMIQSRKLFETRPRSGAVVIVYIFESLMESVSTVPIALVHEAFHFLGRKERYRKSRSKGLNALIANFIVEQIIEGTSNETAIRILKEYIKERMSKLKNEFSNMPEDDSCFYGQEITYKLQKYYENIVWECIQFLENELKVKVETLITKDYDKNELESGLIYEKWDNAGNDINKMKENAQDILHFNHIANALTSFMEIFHEVYADIVAILTCEITPELYEATFEDSSFINKDNRRRDIDKRIRTMYVADIISKQTDILSKDIVDKWIDYRNNIIDDEAKIQSSDIHDDMPSDRSESYSVCTQIKHTKSVKKLFEAYFDKCAKAVVEKLKTIEQLETFRNTFKQIVTGDKEKVLFSIFSGATYSNFAERYESMT